MSRATERESHMDYKDYWTKDDLKNVVAGGCDEGSEGFDVVAFMQQLMSPVLGPETKLLDLGCGYGRLCTVVPPAQYLGVDLNPHAVALAKKNNPEYTFEEIDVVQEYPSADVCMAYTVFLHLDDDTLSNVLLRLREAGIGCIVVAEILGREWRRSGNPPVFNRNLDDYLLQFREAGYTLTHASQRIYKRYLHFANSRNVWLFGLVFER
jgi:SAM-dependent methyltransferase